MCRDGRRVWLEWTNSSVYDGDGKLAGYRVYRDGAVMNASGNAPA
jgi:hypothetical protein